MPVRLLTQSVWRWPTPEQVLADGRRWAQQQQRQVPSLRQVGVFGSYGRGSAAFGSDLGLLLVDAQASGGQIERLQVWPLGDLPLSCDALVLTPEELDQRLSDGTRMAAELRRDLRWML
jgi:UTP:GlnB (protein PII) uridylyltransferase